MVKTQQKDKGEVAPLMEAAAPPLQKSAVEQAADLLDQLDKVRQAAIEELLVQREAIDAKLSRLGYAEATPTRVARPTAPRGAGTEKICPVCGAPGHDRRFHRYEKRKTEALPQASPPDPPAP